MIWTEYQALVAATVMAVLMRALGLFFVTPYAIRRVLRVDNSVSMIKKTLRAANWWRRFTRICFWDMKSSNRGHLRFLIVIRVIGVVTWPITSVATLLAGIWPELTEAAAMFLRVQYYFDCALPFPILFFYTIRFGENRI